MATIQRFEDFEVWQAARELSNLIYSRTTEGAFAKDYSLRDQINRSSGSVMDNIAEGFERDGKNEFVQFLSYSKGSAGEVRSQLYRAFDRNYISAEEFEKLKDKVQHISKMLQGLIFYLRKTEHKGIKYKTQEPESDYTIPNLKLEI